MILFENVSAILSFDSSVPCLELIIKQGFKNSKEFKKAHKICVEKFIELKLEFPNLCIFFDARDLVKIKKREVEWLTAKFFPRLDEAGLSKKAFLYLDSQSGKTILEIYKESLSGTGITLHEFNSYASAKAWLKIRKQEEANLLERHTANE